MHVLDLERKIIAYQIFAATHGFQINYPNLLQCKKNKENSPTKMTVISIKVTILESRFNKAEDKSVFVHQSQ